MTTEVHRAILTICLKAAFADGVESDRERTEIKRIAEQARTLDVGKLLSVVRQP